MIEETEAIYYDMGSLVFKDTDSMDDEIQYSSPTTVAESNSQIKSEELWPT